jgi:hypothetical protein
MTYITEIQGAVVVVIICWCDLQLHMSCITEIQCSCKSHHHMITTTTAPCISVIHDICSCKSHHHMITTTMASCISYWNTRGRCWLDHMVVWFTTTYVMHYWNTRGHRGRVVVNHTTIWSRPRRSLVFQEYMTYVVVNHTTIWSRPDYMVVWFTTTYVIYC